MEEYPRRHENHITEDESWLVLKTRCPSQWILRDISKNDYGIDAYIEIVDEKDLLVRGHLLSLQLKGTKNIKWHDDDDGKFLYSRSIPKSTINYWAELPLPVFLAVVDIENTQVYYCDTNATIRTIFGKYLQNKGVAFPIRETSLLNRKTADTDFFNCYNRAMTFNDFIKDIRTLILHYDQYDDFLLTRQGLDYHLPVEREDVLMMLHIYQLTRFLAFQLRMSWDDVPALEEIRKYDIEVFGEERGMLLHNHSIDKVLIPLHAKFKVVMEKLHITITRYEHEYWTFKHQFIASQIDKIVSRKHS